MQDISEWWVAFQESLRSSLLEVGSYLPSLLAALLVMAIGWLIASIARVGFVRSGGALGNLIDRLGRKAGPQRLRVSERVLGLTGHVVFWIVILISVALASRVAGLDAFSEWLSQLVGYLPTLIAGILIAVAGYLFSTLARDIARTALSSVGARERDLAGLATQTAVLVTAIVVGLDQIGIDVTFLIILVAVVLGGAMISIALAFGFGARDFVGNLIAARQAQRSIEPGDRIRIADVEGRVLEVTATSVILINEAGRHVIPASRLQRDIAIILSDDIDEQ